MTLNKVTETVATQNKDTNTDTKKELKETMGVL